jgi:hypothetical protein
MGERRGVRTVAQQQPSGGVDGSLKDSAKQDEAQSRVPVTALVAWPKLLSARCLRERQVGQKADCILTGKTA